MQYKNFSLLEGYVDSIGVKAQIFGADHTEVVRMLADKIALPDEIRIATGSHHNAPDGIEIDNLVLVSAACSIASALGFSVIAPDRVKTLDEIVTGLPPKLRQRVDPDPAYWHKALLDIPTACSVTT